jgi:polygalacturonase
MGSIGQYPGQIEIIENITAVDIKMINTGYAGRIKSWTGANKGYPPNGGGGGIGHAKNITFRNFDLENVGIAWLITQCTFYDGAENADAPHSSEGPDCTNSQFEVRVNNNPFELLASRH